MSPNPGVGTTSRLNVNTRLAPTATHLAKLTSRFKEGGADFIIRSPYQDARPSNWLSERVGIEAIVLPLTVGGTEQARDLFSLFDDILDRLLQALDHE